MLFGKARVISVSRWVILLPRSNPAPTLTRSTWCWTLLLQQFVYFCVSMAFTESRCWTCPLPVGAAQERSGKFWKHLGTNYYCTTTYSFVKSVSHRHGFPIHTAVGDKTPQPPVEERNVHTLYGYLHHPSAPCLTVTSRQWQVASRYKNIFLTLSRPV